MTKLILKNKGRLETNKEKSGANTHRELHRHTHTLKRKPETQGQTPRAAKEHFLQFQDTIVSFV